MAGIATEGGRDAAKGAAVGGASVGALTAGVGTIALVSMVKVLILLKM